MLSLETMLSRAFYWPGHALPPLILTTVLWGLEALKTPSPLLPSVWDRDSLPMCPGPVLLITLPDSWFICKLIATLQWGWKFKIMVPTWLVPVRALFLAGGWPTTFSLCPMEERKKGLWCLFLLQDHQAHHGGATLVTSSKPNHLLRAPPPNTITLEGKASIYGLGVGRRKHSVHSR